MRLLGSTNDDVLRQALTNAGYDVKTITRTDRSIDTIREQLKANP